MSYEDFQRRWAEGCGSEFCPAASKIVLARGELPCRVLLVGEAPGESENVVGQPFVGPAGQLLDVVIRRAQKKTWNWSYAITNLVACIPRDEAGGKAGQPSDEAIEQCSPRLCEFIRLCDGIVCPETDMISAMDGRLKGYQEGYLKLIVGVGAMARDFLEPGFKYSIPLHRKIPQISITHPAAILRMNIAHRGLQTQKAAITIINGIQDYVGKLADVEG
jgi:uracil-DNA glycosylase family 4